MMAAQVGVESEQKSYQTMQISYMWLQALNRYGAELTLLNQQAGMTAGELYRYLVVMAADLATFTTTLAPVFPKFDLHAIYSSFAPVISSLLLNLRQASNEKVVSITWDDRLFSVRRLLRARIDDKTLFNESRFVLAVTSSLGVTKTRESFLAAAKICGHGRIAERVRSALSAIPINPLAAAPLEIRAKANSVYFEIDTSDELWIEMVKTQDMLALHVDEQMPDNVVIDCYVIR